MTHPAREPLAHLLAYIVSRRTAKRLAAQICDSRALGGPVKRPKRARYVRATTKRRRPQRRYMASDIATREIVYITTPTPKRAP